MYLSYHCGIEIYLISFQVNQHFQYLSYHCGIEILITPADLLKVTSIYRIIVELKSETNNYIYSLFSVFIVSLWN